MKDGMAVRAGYTQARDVCDMYKPAKRGGEAASQVRGYGVLRGKGEEGRTINTTKKMADR